MNAAGRRWAGRELRRRWRSVAALVVLIAVSGGAAMVALSGATRSLAVVDETMEERRQPDVMSLPDRPGFDWSPIEDLPYVESSGLFAATPLCLSETGGLQKWTEGLCTQPPIEGGWYDSIWRIDILEGRMPTGPLEIAVNRLAQERYGWNPGDLLHVEGVKPGRLEDFWGGRPRGPKRWGPTFEVEVTAVFAGEDAWRVISGGVGHPGFVMSASFMPTHGDSIEHRVQAFLRLRNGEDDLRQLHADVIEITGDRAFPIRNVREAQRRVERGTRIEAFALALFAAAVLAAAAVLMGQALVRLVRAGGADAPTLRALGMAPRALISTLALPGALIGLLGALGSVVVVVAASPLTPIGVARSFDLHGGVRFDAAVIVPGALGIVAMATLVSALAALHLLRAPSGAGHREARRTRAIARLPLSPNVALGVRMAFERRPAGESVPVGPTMMGAVVAVLAVVAAITVRDGIADALDNPERAGAVWEVAYYPQLQERALAEDPDIDGAAELTSAIVELDGLPLPGYGIRPAGAPLEPIVIEGRSPRREDELALGPSTAAALDAEVGDTLRAGPESTESARVVGIALLVEDGGHAAYDEGAWVTEAGLERLDPPQIAWTRYFVKVRSGADHAALDERLAAAGGRVDGGLPTSPAALDNLATTRNLPALLAALLALMGAGAIGHAMVTTARRRHRDLAILRALGLSGRAARAALAWQATTIAVVGLLFGVPLGILAGNLIWWWIAESMPLAHVQPGVVVAALAVIPGALLVANAVALWPARTTARARPAEVLRAE